MNEIDKKDVRKGRRYVLILIAIINFYYWLSFVMNLDAERTQIFIRQILALAIIAMVSFLFYRGFEIAAWLSFALLIKPVMTVIYYPFYYLGVLERYNGWLMIVPVVFVILIGGFVMARDNSINEFMSDQKSKRKH